MKVRIFPLLTKDGMKDDQKKPQARRFYWDGLAKLVEPQQMALIKAYQAFSDEPSISQLKKVFEACRALNEPEIDCIVGQVYDYGADKYGDKNYLGLNLDRIIEALGRHLRAVNLAGRIDESGYSHIGHIMANVLIAAELID